MSAPLLPLPTGSAKLATSASRCVFQSAPPGTSDEPAVKSCATSTPWLAPAVKVSVALAPQLAPAARRAVAVTSTSLEAAIGASTLKCTRPPAETTCVPGRAESASAEAIAASTAAPAELRVTVNSCPSGNCRPSADLIGSE